MPIIKAPPKQPKSVTVQARVEEAIKDQLDRYAEFIGSTPSYVITEALKDLFRRDKEFKSWQDQHTGNADEDAPAAHHA
jgi:predicted transcriptional regulator